MSFKFASLLTGAALAVSALATVNAAALDFKPLLHTEMQVAVTPLSMRYFCAQNPGECATSGRGQVTLTEDLLGLLKQVNVHVNRSIRPERDTADVWELNPTSGDCEDYVLSKRSLLVRNGVSSGALRIAYTHTRRGEPHAVLIVRTSQGDLVLDNLTNTVKTLAASGYNIRSMSTGNPNKWTAG